MAIDFILDEDIYRRALEAECTETPFDIRAARVVDILQTSHRWVMTAAVETAYRKQFDKVECEGALPTLFMTRLNENLATVERSYLIEDAPTITGDYPVDDQHMVSAAGARDQGCYLITSDDNLRERLGNATLPKRHHFVVIGLSDAESLLGLR